MIFDKIDDEIKSPLRYPGGKSRAVPQIIPLIPFFKEYREPFVGGGSIFIAVKQRVEPDKVFKINDINTNVCCFWKVLRDQPEQMIEKINEIRELYPISSILHKKVRKWRCETDLERAARFFIINRTSFSGLAESGGYSSTTGRFNDNSIEHLAKMEPVTRDIIITNDDYHVLLEEPGEEVFIFLDPPYYKAKDKKLYGKDGNLSERFDHKRFAREMEKCNHKWLITCDDAPKIRELFSFANIREFNIKYGMNNMSGSTENGKEIFITNYSLPTRKKIF